jgi:hypothetical protein
VITVTGDMLGQLAATRLDDCVCLTLAVAVALTTSAVRLT